MSFDFDDSAFSKMKQEQEPCIEDLSNRTCEHPYSRGNRKGLPCGASLKQEGRGGMIDDLNYCYIDMKKEINNRSSKNLPLGDVIFLIQKDSIYEKRIIEQKEEEQKEEEQQQQEQKEQKEQQIQNEDDQICQYQFTRNGKCHSKGEICSKPVAIHPDIKGGERFCSTHPVQVGEAHEKCETIYLLKNGEEKHCHNNVENKGDRFCQECVCRNQEEAAKERERYEVAKKKIQRKRCVRRLTRGKRRGKLCNEPLPFDCEDDQRFCTKCSKTKDVQKLQDVEEDEEDDSSSSSINEEERENENEIFDEILAPPKDLPLLVGSNDNLKITLSKLRIAPHWRYITELLLLKTLEPGPLVQMLFWFSNGKFKSTDGTNLFECSSDEWVKISRPTTRLNRLLDELISHLSQNVLSPLKRAGEQSDLIEKIQSKIVLHLKKELPRIVVDRFIELIFNLQEKVRDPQEINLLEFFRGSNVILISDNKKAISTSQILNHFNEWLTKNEKPNYPSGAAHFGRLLTKINNQNLKWKVNSAGKHLIQLL